MRLWTVDPAFLDARGLTAAWREGLLARAVLRGRTKGYRFHPQLARFRAQKEPVAAAEAYLRGVLAEACRRGYHFDARKLGPASPVPRIRTTCGQLQHEWAHLGAKLRRRSPADYRRWRAAAPRAHRLFRIVPGPVERWEVPAILKDSSDRGAARRAARRRGRART